MHRFLLGFQRTDSPDSESRELEGGLREAQAGAQIRGLMVATSRECGDEAERRTTSAVEHQAKAY
jgi:hypothetical protein